MTDGYTQDRPIFDLSQSEAEQRRLSSQPRCWFELIEKGLRQGVYWLTGRSGRMDKSWQSFTEGLLLRATHYPQAEPSVAIVDEKPALRVLAQPDREQKF